MKFLEKKLESDDYNLFFISILFLFSIVFLISRSFFSNSQIADFTIFFLVIASYEIIHNCFIYKSINFKLEEKKTYLLVLILSLITTYLWLDNSTFFYEIIFFLIILTTVSVIFLPPKRIKFDRRIIILLPYLSTIGILFYLKISYQNLIIFFSTVFLIYIFMKYKENFFKNLDLLFSILIFVIFLKIFLLSSEKDAFHYSWYLGPVNSILNGGSLLIDTVSQYGYLNILLIEKLSGLFSINPSKIINILIILGLLFFTYVFLKFAFKEVNLPLFVIIGGSAFLIFGNMGFSELSGAMFIPSSSVYRFLPSILFILSISAYDFKSSKQYFKTSIILLLFLLSILWSFESLIFSTLSIFSAYLFCIILNFQEKKFVFNKVFLLLLAFTTLTFFYLNFNKNIIFFYEYSTNLDSSALRINIEMNKFTLSFFGVLSFLFFFWRNTIIKKDIFFTFKNTLWFTLSMAFSIYYLIRSHPNNFFNILPFLIFFIMNIKVNDISLLKFKKRFLNFFFLIVFSTSLIPIFNNYEKFKTVFFDNNIFKTSNYEVVKIDEKIIEEIEKNPNIPVTIISGKTIHVENQNINSGGFGLPILPLEQFNRLSTNRKIELFDIFFKKNNKHFILCTNPCDQYNELNKMNSWNDLFVPSDFEIIKKVDRLNSNLFIVKK